jgi:rod shape-determining protein MreC
MIRNWRANRWVFLSVCLLIGFGLIAASRIGLLAPIEGFIAPPINAITGIFNRTAVSVSKNAASQNDIDALRKRNAELEEALAKFQSELVDLREIASDYERLSGLLRYTSSVKNQEYVAANVISVDENAQLRTIAINRGARDGIAVGMPVVTQQGLIGRVLNVSANAARILLVSDPSSSVSARLQTSRAEGSVIGQLSGNLRMTFIPLNSVIQEGDLVVTSGLGGNFPAGIVIGQVTSKRQFEYELFQEAEIRSLNNFDTLEIVLVITNFQPVDLSVFENVTPAAPGTGQ